MSNKIDIIGNLLADCIAHAPEMDQQQLAQALEDYFEQYPNTRVQGRMLSTLLDAMIEGSDARATYRRQS